MNIEFATCSRKTAFEYIQKVYPSIEIKEPMISELLDLVEKDIIRVRDPYMYGSVIAVIAGNNYKTENKAEIDDAIWQLKENKLI